MAQPSDLRNPVNGQPTMTVAQMFGSASAPSEPSLGQFLGGGAARAPAGAAPPSAPAAAQPNAGGASDQALLSAFGPGTAAPPQGQNAPAGEPSDSDLLNAFGGGPAPAGFERFAAGAADETTEDGQGAGFLARLRAGLGRTTAEQASLFEKTFGSGNVKVRSGKIYFRRQGEKKYQSVEPEKLGFWADLLSDLADNSGSALEAAYAVPFEAAGAVAGAAAGGPPGAVAGVGAGLAAGGALGADARRSVMQMAGGQVDPNVDQNQERLFGAGANVIGGAAGAGLAKAGQGAVKMIARAMDEVPMARIKSLSRISAALDNMVSEYRLDPKLASKTETGTSVRTAAQKERDILNNQVSMMRETVVELAKDQKFPVTNTLSHLKKTLQDKGATFDDTGNALLNGKLPDAELSYRAPVERASSIVDPSGSPYTVSEMRNQSLTIPGAEVREPLKPFGAAGGSPLMDSMAADYNRLLKEQANGGVSAQELFDLTSYYQDRSSFDKDFGTKVTSQWKMLQHEAASDRNMAAGLVLRGTPEEGAFTRAYQEFTDRTDALKQFEKIIVKAEKTGGLGAISDAVIQKERPEKVARFKALFGDGDNFDSITGPVWNKVKGEWINTLVQRNTSASTGIVDGAGILAELKGYGKETLNEVLSGEEQAALKKLALKATKISTSGLVRPEEYSQDLMRAPFFKGMMASTKASILWRLTRQDAKAADFLLDDGFMQAARNAAPDYRREVLQTMQEYRTLYNMALRRRLPNGKEVLVDVPTAFGKAAARNQVGTSARDQVRRETITFPEGMEISPQAAEADALIKQATGAE